MNQLFVYQRFKLLLRRYFIENRKLFLMGGTVMLFIGIVFYAINTKWSLDLELDKFVRQASFFVGLILFGSIFSNYLFRDFGQKGSTIHLLMIPASTLEKLVSGMVYALLLFPVAYFIFFLLFDSLYVVLLNQWGAKNLFLWEFEDTAQKNVIKTLLGLQLYYVIIIIGTIQFQRNSYIKTLLFMSTYFGFLGSFIYIIQKVILPLNDSSESVSYTASATNTSFWDPVDFILLAHLIVLAIMAYFKLKEKEV
jgi:hypothetical protein